MKLSESQFFVIEKMQQGWELGKTKYTSLNGSHCWLQKGYLGCGGETIKVSVTTFNSLVKKELIIKDEFPSKRYLLTDLGKSIKREL